MSAKVERSFWEYLKSDGVNLGGDDLKQGIFNDSKALKNALLKDT